MKFLLKLWLCKILGLHRWTTPVQKGILIMPKDKATATVKEWGMALYESSKMTCDLCGEESQPSKNMYYRIKTLTQ